jgi:hypothetical protein
MLAKVAPCMVAKSMPNITVAIRSTFLRSCICDFNPVGFPHAALIRDRTRPRSSTRIASQRAGRLPALRRRIPQGADLFCNLAGSHRAGNRPKPCRPPLWLLPCETASTACTLCTCTWPISVPRPNQVSHPSASTCLPNGRVGR